MHAVPLSADDVARPLRGVRQRHPVAALPRRRRAAGLPPPLVGGVPAGQPAVRGGGRRGRRAGRRGLGAGLPPAARAGPAPRRCGPTCASGSSCTCRSRRPSCSCSCPAAPSCCAGILGADLVGFQRAQAAHNFAQLAAKVLELPATDRRVEVGGRIVRIGAFPVSIDIAEMEALAGSPEVTARPAAAARRPRRPRTGDPQPSTGWTTPRASSSGSRRTASCSPSGRVKVARHRAGAGRGAQPAAGRAVPGRCGERVEREVGRINGEYGRVGEPAIHYLNQLVRPRRAGRALPGRRRHGGHPAARRDEPGRQGVRGRPASTTAARWCSASSPARPPS